MVNEKILEFYEEFRDEVLGYVKENMTSVFRNILDRFIIGQ